MSDILDVKGLKKAFGGREVLKGLDLAAARGEVIGILGRNGSGKTTLFSILLDLVSADGGSAEVLGLRPDGSGRLRGLIGYVPEKPAFHGFMTAGEVLAFRARFFPRWDMPKALDLCKKLELDPAAGVAAMSKGNLAKLAWITAVAHNPELLLLDEPTSGLDYLVRDHILNGLIHELTEGGRTIIVSNHRMGEMGGILDRVCVLKDGVIAASHGAAFLAEEAFRAAARLETPLSLPEGVVALGGGGALREFAVFGRKNLEKLRLDPAFAGAEISPLLLEDSFKVLLGE
ncbi:MAG: ABC transporter ATP-binding protein [Elusimicrobiales bacterium]|nr:ABC transporter ATP-binding protein [Elusimicrobiales bacterium]